MRNTENQSCIPTCKGIEQLGRKHCHYLCTIDLRDAFHTL